jgi:hypothetical protein
MRWLDNCFASMRFVVLRFVILSITLLVTNQTPAKMIDGIPIKEGDWHGETIEYAANHLLVKIAESADSAKVDSL